MLNTVGILLFAVILLVATTYLAFAENSKIEVRGSIDDGTSTLQDSGIITKYFTTGARQSQLVTLTAGAFTAFTKPSAAEALLIDIGSVRSLRLKGVTGDVGISLDSNCPVLLPISDDNVTIGILSNNASNTTVRLYWF